MKSKAFRLAAAAVAALALSTAAVSSAAASSSSAAAGAKAAGGTPAQVACASLTGVTLANTTIGSATQVAATSTVPAYCDVQATVTNPPLYTDSVKVGVFLPTDNWNGNLEGTGGSGFSGGSPTVPNTSALSSGYVTAGTDAGHTGNSGSFALNADGTQNWQLIDDFGYLAIHEMTATAKALIQAYYARPVTYSFFNGCSTAGRQGLIEAQDYPADYNGIAAGSPAINSNQLRAAQIWGELQMKLANDFLPQCKLTAFNNAAIAACDNLDGVTDGIISDWQDCHFSADSLIGTVTSCGTITATDASIVTKIWDGPTDANGSQLWYGLQPGASFTGVDNTVTVSGTTTGAPSSTSTDWYKYFLTLNPAFDWQTLTYQQFLDFFAQSQSEYASMDPTSDAQPDLTAFDNDGGKIVMWSGTYDQLVYQLGDLNYYQRVEATIGGPQNGAVNTDAFMRFYFDPGVAHCGGGAGATPTDQFQAVVNWVELGAAPDYLNGAKTNSAGAVVMTRPVCMYPLVARYIGGDTNSASSFTCAASFTGKIARAPARRSPVDS
jgi:hypothetical protein